MQQCFMFIDTGNGWTPVNDSAKDIAAFDSFTIDWGSNGIEEQPEPAVMSFTLRDRTGRLAGQALTLAGMKVVVQFSDQPRWQDLQPSMGDWEDLRIPIDSLHRAYSPNSPDSPDSPASTMFIGTVSTGGSIEPASDGGWLLKLSATSRMAVWKRLQSQGPTDTAAKWNGAHWIGTPSARLKEMNRRASAQGAPEAQLDGLALPSSVAPYTPSDHPSQLDLLHRLTAGPRLPQWHEVYDGAASTLRPLFLADPIAVHLSTDGRLNVLADGETRHALSAADIEASTDLSITEPLTQVVINAKRVKSDNGKLSFDDVEITMGDQNRLPPQLTAMQKSLTIDSDMLAVDASGGVWNSGRHLERQRHGPRQHRAMARIARPAHGTGDSDVRQHANRPGTTSMAIQGKPIRPIHHRQGQGVGPDRLRRTPGIHRPHHDHRRNALIPVAREQADTHPGSDAHRAPAAPDEPHHMGRPAIHPQLATARPAHLRPLDDPDNRLKKGTP